MRKWCVTLAMGAFLAMPAVGQQENNRAAEETGNNSTNAEKGALANGAALSAPAPRNPFAAPASPGRTPFASDNAAKNRTTEEAPGRLLPRYEIAGMYDYLSFNPGGPFESFSGHGGSGSFTYNATKLLGLTGEIGGNHFDRNLNNGTAPPAPADKVQGGITTYLFGPRLNLRRFDYFVPFAEILFGGAHSGAQITGDKSQSSFAMAVGGGVDVVLHKNLAWRFFQADYLMTNFSGSALGETSRQ